MENDGQAPLPQGQQGVQQVIFGTDPLIILLVSVSVSATNPSLAFLSLCIFWAIISR